jgi:hypothetical protein
MGYKSTMPPPFSPPEDLLHRPSTSSLQTASSKAQHSELAASTAHLTRATKPSKNSTPTMDGYYVYSQSAQQPVPVASFRPSKPEDWEPYREIIAHLYNTMNMKLKDVMAEMQVTYGFKAT